MSNTIQQDDVMAILRRFKEGRGETYGIKKIGVFGSVARGDPKRDLDIDIVYETDTPNLFRTSHMRQELEELMGRHVDVVRLRSHMNPRLKARIEREAHYA